MTCQSATPVTWLGRCGAERVVEVAPLPVEGVGVCLSAVALLDEVGVSGLLERRDRVLLGVGVHVAEDEDVRVAGARRVTREPVASSSAERTRTALQLPCPSPASGALHALPLLLRWLATAMNVPPLACRGTPGRARDGCAGRSRPR